MVVVVVAVVVVVHGTWGISTSRLRLVSRRMVVDCHIHVSSVVEVVTLKRTTIYLYYSSSIMRRM